ncbi:MAG: hypothetical protein LBR25_08060 [Erysipelotrichaceae bacterium]|jgi:serpin B|nr:hypothetical protein [Erysipelotrichaceae bacterium]
MESINEVRIENKALKDLGHKALQGSIRENAFAFMIARQLFQKQKQDDNFVFSPFSLWLTLAALVNAVKPEYVPELLAELKAEGIRTSQLNDHVSTLLFSLLGEANKAYIKDFVPSLRITNALFVSQAETIRPDFAQIFAQNYQGTAFQVDFFSPKAAKAINDWARKHTEGLIDHLVDGFDQDTVAAIANAIYFSDHWSREFKESDTKPGVFHSINGDMQVAYMCKEANDFNYYEDESVQAVSLAYNQGGSMWILLAKNESVRELYQRLSEDDFKQIETQSKPSCGKLLLPRFSATNHHNLNSVLSSLNIPLFDRKAAVLKGGLICDDKPVWLSAAMQQAVIQVDEKGTTAGAVTLIMMAGSALHLPGEPFVMHCDKPFVFLLQKQSRILFSGIINKPSPVSK